MNNRYRVGETVHNGHRMASEIRQKEIPHVLYSAY